MSAPWTFDEAVTRCSGASKRQEEAEQALGEAYRGFAQAQEAYALKLAKGIESLREMSVPATVCLELAKGMSDVAELRMERDQWAGLKAVAEQACWRRNADRKDAQRFSDWSQRRELAEAGNDMRPTYSEPIGAGR